MHAAGRTANARRARLRRWGVAVSGALLVHALIFAGLAYRRYHAPPRSDDAIVVTFERLPIEREKTPPPPPTPVQARSAPLIQSPVIAAYPEAIAAPAPSRPSAPASPETRTAEAKGPPMKLGCFSSGLKGKAKEDCDRQTIREMMKKPDQAYAVLAPPDPDAPKPPEPGWHIGPPIGIVYVYGAEDKHFLPGQGKSDFRVLKRAEIYNVPKPQQ